MSATTGLMRIETFFALSLVLLACKEESTPTAEPPGAAAPSPAPAPQAVESPSSSAQLAPPQAGGFTWDAPEPLVRRAPKSSMRVAEYGVAGDEHAELGVFYFGADQGGSVDANITRWLGQLTQPDGSDTALKAKRSERKVGDIAVSLVEAQGAYKGGMAMPGAPPPTPIDDALLLAAIATGSQGPVFFKLIGPRETVERARPAFDALIASLHSVGAR